MLWFSYTFFSYFNGLRKCLPILPHSHRCGLGGQKSETLNAGGADTSPLTMERTAHEKDIINQIEALFAGSDGYGLGRTEEDIDKAYELYAKHFRFCSANCSDCCGDWRVGCYKRKQPKKPKKAKPTQ